MQRDYSLTSSQILSQVDLANTENPGKWRADRFPCNRGAHFSDSGFSGFLLGRGAIVFHAGNYALTYQLLRAAKVDMGEIPVSLGGC